MTYTLKKVMTVPNPAANYSNFGCFSVDSKTMETFTLKGNNADKGILQYYKKYTDSSSVHKITITCGHGNCMGMGNTYLFFPISNVNKATRVKRSSLADGKTAFDIVTFPSGITVSSMAYRGNNIYYCVVDKTYTSNGIEYAKVQEMEIDNANKKFNPKRIFLVPKPNNSANFQDCGYKSGYGLCFAFPYKDDKGKLIKNTITQINPAGPTGGNIDGMDVYKPVRNIIVNKSAGSYEKFEIESVSFDVNGYMLFCGNVRKAGAGSDSDGIYRITNQKFPL